MQKKHCLEYFGEVKKYNVEKVSWEEGLKQADYISVNLKGCDENINKLSMKDFKLMKNTAYLINTAIGKILKEEYGKEVEYDF